MIQGENLHLHLPSWKKGEDIMPEGVKLVKLLTGLELHPEHFRNLHRGENGKLPVFAEMMFPKHLYSILNPLHRKKIVFEGDLH